MNEKQGNMGEVILFPGTLDYYQIELTKLLESEKYGDAIRMLKFLLECRTQDIRAAEEWRTLLEWLRVEFPQDDSECNGGDGLNAAPSADAEEEELRRGSVSAKTTKDRNFARQLLEMWPQTDIDKQLLALDQLAFADDPAVTETLIRQLHDLPLHPFVSFKLLQTLRRRGMSGEATFAKLGEIVTVDVERTPLDAFPAPLSEMIDRVQAVADVNDPTLSHFAKQTWQEFLMYIYGTMLYRDLTAVTDGGIDAWAGALHYTVSTAMYGEEVEQTTWDNYGITDELLFLWERACRELRKFFQDNAGPGV